MPLALLYHAVLRIPDTVAPQDRTLMVEPDELAWQFEELVRRGFRSLTLAEFQRAVELREHDPKTVLLTFDDAYAHVLPTVTPLLEEHGLTAALFASPGHAGATNDWDGPALPVHGLPIASLGDLRAAAASGRWELGSHAFRHVDLRTLDRSSRLDALVRAREELCALAGRDVDALAYPYGASDDAVRSDARQAGYRIAFAAGATPSDDLYAVPRLAIRGQEGRRAFRIKTDDELRRVFE